MSNSLLTGNPEVPSATVLNLVQGVYDHAYETFPHHHLLCVVCTVITDPKHELGDVHTTSSANERKLDIFSILIAACAISSPGSFI